MVAPPQAEALEVKSLFGKQNIKNEMGGQDSFAAMKAAAAAKAADEGVASQVKLPETSLSCPEGSYLVSEKSSASFYCAKFGVDENYDPALDEAKARLEFEE
eukprot:PRCOL_00001714-RA